MQLDPMRSWLKALVLLAALAVAFPCAAWAHAGHELGASHSAASTGVAPDGVPHAIDASYSAVLARRAAQALRVTFAPVIPERRVAPLQENDPEGSGVIVRDGPPDEAASPAGKPISPLHQGNCCCGSFACHAGVDAPVDNMAGPCAFSKKIDLPPVLALAGTVPDGIERPPRSCVPALARRLAYKCVRQRQARAVGR